MYPNITLIQVNNAQYRQERMHEAEIDRRIREAYAEQEEEEQRSERVVQDSRVRRVWQALESSVGALLG